MVKIELSSPQTVLLSQPTSKAAYDYWNALRNGGTLPRRRDIDPSRMRAFLPDIMLVERVSSEAVIFRLAGTGICFAFGRELRDHSLLTLWEPSHRSLIGAALPRSLSQAAPLLLRFRAHALGRRPLPGEMLLLPLLDDDGAATRFLCSFACARDPAGPKTFTRLELVHGEMIRPSRDRVELTAPAPVPRWVAPRLVQPSAPPRPVPTMSRPWAGLFQGFLRSEEG